jgi:hypothetical protein
VAQRALVRFNQISLSPLEFGSFLFLAVLWMSAKELFGKDSISFERHTVAVALFFISS